MSGDIGRGATKEAIDFAISLSSAKNRPPGKSLNPLSSIKILNTCEFMFKMPYFTLGFLQLAGGTNAHTIDSLKNAGLFQTRPIPGIVPVS